MKLKRTALAWVPLFGQQTCGGSSSGEHERDQELVDMVPNATYYYLPACQC